MGALPAPRQQRQVLKWDASGTPWTPAPAPAKGGLGDLPVLPDCLCFFTPLAQVLKTRSTSLTRRVLGRTFCEVLSAYVGQKDKIPSARNG